MTEPSSSTPQIHTDLSIIFGMVVGAMLRAGVTPEDIQSALSQMFEVGKAIIDRPEVTQALSDVLVTTVLDALEGP